MRLISLTGVPPDFGKQVTRATNTQNTLEARDFVALDPLQSALREDFALRLGKRYAVKRGEDEPVGVEGCSVVEAADALACAHPDHSLAVLAKRERGLLLETEDSYYRQLFTPDLTSDLVWHWVEVLRLVEAGLAERQRAGGPVEAGLGARQPADRPLGLPSATQPIGRCATAGRCRASIDAEAPRPPD